MSDTPQSPEERHERIRAAQIDHLVAVMRERFPVAPPCPWCGKSDYSIDEVVSLYPNSGGIVSPVVYPCFQVICTSCGHTTLFNASVLGLMDDLRAAADATAPPTEQPTPGPGGE